MENMPRRKEVQEWADYAAMQRGVKHLWPLVASLKKHTV
jgi:hypothetical protein